MLSHCRIRIIVLTRPDNINVILQVSARNHQKKSCVPAKSHKSQWCEANIIAIEIFAPFLFGLFVSRLESTTTKSLFRHLHCRRSLLFKSHRWKLCSNWREQHGRICCFAIGPVYQNKSQTMCSSDFVFWKYKQDSAFHVSGGLQLAKTGPLVMKNFLLLRLFLSDAMIAWKFYTPYDVNCTNLHILTASWMLHILTRIGQL